MEKDDEIKGEGNSYTTFWRQYDPRLMRWKSVDPVTHHSLSPYNAFDNNPILYVDPKGSNSSDFYDKDGETLLFHIEDGSNATYTLSGDNKSNESFEFSGFDESQGGENEINVGGAIEGAQKYVLENYKSVENNGSWETYCNYGCMNVSKTANNAVVESGGEISNINLIQGRANNIISNLSSLSNVTLEQAKTDAANGNLVVGGWSGHVFTLRKDGLINNVGSWSAKPNNNVFDPEYAPSGVKFYSFKPVLSLPINTYGPVSLSEFQVEEDAPDGWSGGLTTRSKPITTINLE